ncbi:hypothetical protein EDC18_1042 [Natranaerovirga pectinivora]|uniref:Uncharacterized protein n=1 Tax=Natranaerovirga pectinivora TaxID=682400 RepID=A0A4R3MLG7_9FIRM|nr:hypothetical protein [Natranaerovirga pectinivora]TCT14856.1 hypothetical protein EDC18_1042 [Natranaerovirga pectinivora]
MFLPLYSENLIINPLLHDSFSEEGQMMLQYLMTEVSQRRTSRLLTSLQNSLIEINKKGFNTDVLKTVPYNVFKNIEELSVRNVC